MFLQSQCVCCHAGMEVVRKLESYGTDSGRPSQSVIIAGCGELASADDVEKIIDENKRMALEASTA